MRRIDRPPRLLYVTNTDWYFVTHRLSHAIAAMDAGYEVHVATPDTGWASRIAAAGITHHPVEFARGGGSPAQDLRTALELFSLCRRVRPQLLHLVAARAVIVGGLAALPLPWIRVVYAIAGQGYANLGESGTVERVRLFVTALLMRRPLSRVIVQTKADIDFYVQKRIVRQRRLRLIAGVGVSVPASPLPDLPATPVVLFAGRLFREKGIEDLVAVVPDVRRSLPQTRVIVAGPLEPGLASGIGREQVDAWGSQGLIEYVGHLPDVQTLLAGASVVVLPTYHREGVPKILLEAAAAGVPIVASDIPACREVLVHGRDALLVTPQDRSGLAAAIVRVLTDHHLADRLRESARQRVAAEFSLTRSAEAVLEVYADLGVPPE